MYMYIYIYLFTCLDGVCARAVVVAQRQVDGGERRGDGADAQMAREQVAHDLGGDQVARDLVGGPDHSVDHRAVAEAARLRLVAPQTDPAHKGRVGGLEG